MSEQMHVSDALTSAPRVSVITPAYNAGAFLADALHSVLRQTWVDWELIVVDDGSTDQTKSIVESFLPAFAGKLRYIHQSNSGLPAARNTAIRHARGEFIALLDADDVWLETRLERGVAVMDSNPTVGLVHARVVRIDGAGQVTDHPHCPPAKYLAGRIARYLYTRDAHILCPTVLFRRSCLEKAGMFDERMKETDRAAWRQSPPSGTCDRDLWFRIAKWYPVAYVPEVIACYRISANAMSRDTERMRASQMYFLRKHRRNLAFGGIAFLRALGNLHRERGDELFTDGAVARSLASYTKGVLCNPLSLRNDYMLVRALSDPIVSRVRQSLHL